MDHFLVAWRRGPPICSTLMVQSSVHLAPSADWWRASVLAAMTPEDDPDEGPVDLSCARRAPGAVPAAWGGGRRVANSASSLGRLSRALKVARMAPNRELLRATHVGARRQKRLRQADRSGAGGAGRDRKVRPIRRDRHGGRGVRAPVGDTGKTTLRDQARNWQKGEGVTTMKRAAAISTRKAA